MIQRGYPRIAFVLLQIPPYLFLQRCCYRSLRGFLVVFAVVTLPSATHLTTECVNTVHERNYYTVCSPPQPVHEPQDHAGTCGSSLLPAPLRWVQESCFQEPDAEICHLGSQCLQGPIHLRPTRLPLSLEMLGHMLGDSPPEKTQSSDAQGSSYLWVIWFREGQHIQIQFPQFTYWCGHIFYVQGTTSSKCSSVLIMSSFLRCMDISGGKNNFQTWLMQLLRTV